MRSSFACKKTSSGSPCSTITPALKDYVEKKITKVTKQFKTVGDISAVLKVEKGNHIVEITVPASGILLRAQETTKDMYSSIDLVIEKIERQIHKYKTRLMKRKYNNFQDAGVTSMFLPRTFTFIIHTSLNSPR